MKRGLRWVDGGPGWSIAIASKGVVLVLVVVFVVVFVSNSIRVEL